MDPSPLDPARIAHLIWTAIITILGGVLHWNWTKLNTEVQSKADKEDVQRQLDEILEERRADRQAVAEMHVSNSKRLDAIYNLLVQQKRGH